MAQRALSQQGASMSDEFVTVATYPTLPEAEAARLMLETEGIPAMLSDAEIVNMDWLLGNAVGYIKLRVPPQQAETAFRLLGQIDDERRRRRAEAEEDVDTGRPVSDDMVCLACGAAMPEDEDRCPVCGWSYDEGRDEI
jgi:rubrerythrin